MQANYLFFILYLLFALSYVPLFKLVPQKQHKYSLVHCSYHTTVRIFSLQRRRLNHNCFVYMQLHTSQTEFLLTVVYFVLPFYSPTQSVKRTFLKPNVYVLVTNLHHVYNNNFNITASFIVLILQLFAFFFTKAIFKPRLFCLHATLHKAD